MYQLFTLALLVSTTCAQQYSNPYHTYDTNNNTNNQYGTNRQYDNRPPPPYGSNSYSGSQSYNNQQYGGNPSYDVNNRNQPYDPSRPYDPNRPYDRNSNDRDRDRQRYDDRQFDPNRPYDSNRSHYDNHNRSQYDNYNRTQYDSRPYDPNNRQYDANRYDPNRPNDPNRPYDPNNRYDPSRPYDPNRPYDSNNRQFDANNRQHDANNRQFDANNRQYDANNKYDQSFGYNQQQYGNNNDDDCCDNYCYTEDPEPYLKFATKTSYETLEKRSGNQHVIPECTPLQFWSLNRHGTRLPGRRRIEALRRLENLKQQVVLNHEERQSYPSKGRLCVRDYDLLKRWRWNDTINDQSANKLTDEGINELRLLARRFQNKFPDILNKQYNERDYYFQYTDSDRTHASYQAYIEGLFGPDAYRVHANFFPDDKLIKNYKTCRVWQEQVDYNPRTMEEYNRFVQMPEYQQMVRNVFRKLGFRITLNASIVQDIYDMCRYEKAWYINRPSAWCTAFTKDQLKILEYANDLKSYYQEGYGNELNKRIGCPPLKDMYQKFERAINGDRDGAKASFYFTHAQTVGSTLAAMGIAKDFQPLRADNYHQQNRRQWRDSTVLPFAANLVAVLYECRSPEKHRVMFFLNEEPVEFPQCQVGLCNWSTVQQMFGNTVENCNLDFCNGNSATKTYSSLLAFLLFPVLHFLFSRI